MDAYTLLKELSEAPGVAGFETEVVALIRGHWAPYIDEWRQDPLGNLIGIRRGAIAEGQPRRSIMLAGHCDEIGLMVSGMQDGFLRVVKMGGIDTRLLPGQEVTVHGRKSLPGVIGLRPPHLVSQEERKKPVPLDELFVDVGMGQEQVEGRISIGDPISFRVPLTALSGERVSGKALDNRTSAVVTALCLEEVSRLHHSWDIYAVATTQEEIGLRGAIVSAFGLNPDVAIALDVTFGEGPGITEEDGFKMGGGAVLGIGPNVHPALYAALQDVAQSLEMPVQVEPLPAHSGTDAWAIQVAREGIPTGIVSVPVQNMHSPVEVVSLKDIRRSGRLLAQFIRRLDEAFAVGLTFDQSLKTSNAAKG